MAIQYSLSYDKDGNPSLTKNTVKGSTPVVKTEFNIGEYKPTRTIQEFANTASFDDLQAGKKSETINKALQNYIYQNNSNSDGDKDVESNKTFSEQSFEAAKTTDITGTTGFAAPGSTFTEKAKMASVEAYIESKLSPVKSAILGEVPVIGTIYKTLAFAGSNFVDKYYDPVHEDYYYTGFGAFTKEGESTVIDRLSRAGGVDVNNTKVPSGYMYDTDYFGTTKSDINTANKAFAAKQNEIGKALHGDNGNKDKGSISNEQAATNREGRRGGQYSDGNGGNQGGGDLSSTEGSF